MLKSFVARAACAVAVVVGFALPAAAAAYDKVIAFGDSLTDTGNFFAATTVLANLGAPVLPTPQAPAYYMGRFSNGPVAVEVLAKGLGVGLENYAYGGATSTLLNGAATAAQGFPPSLTDTGLLSQVATFSNRLGGQAADANALYFVWAGSNDFRYYGFTPAVAQQTIQNLVGSVSQLYDLGARNFLLPLLPDLGLTPEGLSQGPLSPVISGFSQQFNTSLASAYSQLLGLPGIHYTLFDTLASQRALVQGAPANGFTNVTTPCFSGSAGSPAGTVCNDVTGYMFFDSVHPTAATHAVLGAQMLAAVPEPETVMMLLSGLVVLVAVKRRRT